ncbi:hypothetical protein Ait01nite_091210 [Actinoplanes italicus]|jgi:hypothetical protein|uniref:Uncharacterized protein n=1 Tax=Actinoplanes italicus TaxID=113567 RepID=A0A2T0JSB6_9ACTN|nr:hypothetical protein CLV67_1334 [Actinoplanes italicus]GIE36076.1 hypothetical protein Ait01nite_091210 [Actinoplanes italicus]
MVSCRGWWLHMVVQFVVFLSAYSNPGSRTGEWPVSDFGAVRPVLLVVAVILAEVCCIDR